MEDTTDFNQKVIDVIKPYLANEAFLNRKITDTPTDVLQVTPKGYVDTKVNSVVGQVSSISSSLISVVSSVTSSLISAVNTTLSQKIKFGGTGTDGALNLASSITTINCGGVNIFYKNYTSINISSTAGLAFSNPANEGTIVVLKSQGDVTIVTSQNPAIDLRGMGGKGGSVMAAVTGAGGGGAGGASAINDGFVGNGGNTGATGNNGTGFGQWIYGKVQTGGAGGGPSAGSVFGGVNAGLSKIAYQTLPAGVLFSKLYVTPGSGGGGGGGGTGDQGKAGGRGGGALWMEVGGNFVNTQDINAAGQAGGDSGGGNGGPGGGGGGGAIAILVNGSINDVVTKTVTGGAAGSAGGLGVAGPGGDGFAVRITNTEMS